MAKSKKFYRCKSCQYKSVQWSGKCPSCAKWDSLVEEVEIKDDKNAARKILGSESTLQQVFKLGDRVNQAEIRLKTPDEEFNRVLGGGVVVGSLILVGGKPGIGKSTLLLQLCLKWKGQKILYLSGEESLHQVSLRANRLEKLHDETYFLADTSLDHLEKVLKDERPNILVIDSIQTLQKSTVESSPGSVSQIRECTHHLMLLAKQLDCSIFIIGHITKDGYIAGPKVLEHMVDVVLYFDDSHLSYRFIKSTKNRFGTTSEVGIYEMTSQGLNQVINPSDIFLDQFDQEAPGVAIAPILGGMRTLLVEIQALISPSFYGTPQRTSNGYDSKRLAMLLAVLEKHCGLKLGQHDVFLNITGGVKVNDPSVDLAVIAALVSSYLDQALPKGIVLSGEIGLTGEIRGTKLLAERANECGRLGFRAICHSSKNSLTTSVIKAVPLASTSELVRRVFKSEG